MKNNFKDSIRFILLFMVWLFSASFAFSDNEEKKVLLMKIDSEIDPRTNRYSELALDYAKEIEADLVILE
ncbi:MAG: nodulation protein NfeD, partial [Cyclobacteriaceae bacterium]|nr:nodulation protein NfeD [Cyclobacteriaceae bacterium]